MAKRGKCSVGAAPTLTICRQIQGWDAKARTTPTLGTDECPNCASGGTMLDCMDIKCLCFFFDGKDQANCVVKGRPVGKVVRKEYRMLSDDERQRFHQALRTLKSNGEYDRLARVHAQWAESGAAHSGPAFLPWHREFVKRMEFLIRQVDPSLHLPYWDSTLDQNLPDSKDSLLWSNEFMGDAQGSVNNGPFRSWRTIENKATITRAVAREGKGYSDDEITIMMGQSDIAQVLSFSAPQRGCPYQPNFNVPEYMHGNPHLYVGGDMHETNTAANDPIFWLHHSFVDLLWEQYRQTKQSRAIRETAYPADNRLCSSEHHFKEAVMRPFFPLRNVDGLSNKYTDNLYSFAPRPSCNAGPTCGSQYLFCDRSHGAPRCAARMKPGGNCASFTNGEQACYQGTCQGGRCVATSSVVTPPPSISPSQSMVELRAACFNENECCGSWAAQGECQRNPGYMKVWCKASCRQCTPNYDINNECSDRHPSCSMWSGKGECNRNRLWMSENCRRSCNKCGITRATACGGGGRASNVANNNAAPLQTRWFQQCDNPRCFNDHPCCPVWAQRGYCQTNPAWMSCQCKLSCGGCRPSFAYGTCADYHPECPAWANQGECQMNNWMPENCRRSCNTCIPPQRLASMCANRMARSAFLDAVLMMKK